MNEIRVHQATSGMSGVAFWRMLWVAHLLNMKGKIKVYSSDLVTKNLMDYARISVLHLQRKGSGAQYELFKKIAKLKARFKLRMIYELDDAIFLDAVPKYNQSREELEANAEKLEEIRKTIGLCDEMTVTTHTLKNYLLERTEQKNITVIPNYLPGYLYGHLYDEENLRRNYRRHHQRPRILYAGSPSHFQLHGSQGEEIIDDFTHIKEAVLSTIREFQWVFVGALPIILQPFAEERMVEFHPWVPICDYPSFLASLNCNMAIAPLHDNLFNRCKSDLKFLEASALGLPVMCQDLCTYTIAPIRFTTGNQLIEQIQKTLKTEEGYLEASRAGRKLIQSRWLENKENFGKYVELYTYPYDSHHRHLLS